MKTKFKNVSQIRVFIFFIVLSIAIYGCTTKKLPRKSSVYISVKSNFETLRKINQGFLGTWGSKESSALFKIRAIDGQYKIDAWDGDDGETFTISEIIWNEKELKIMIEMPSTKHNIQIDLSVIDHNKLQCLYSGDRYGQSIWHRKADD